jgi:putative phosphoribosyl transferase
MFDDRRDAGEKLGRALVRYKDRRALVLAIPRGGVEVGCQVARHLDADLSIIIARKLPFPDNPESGFGAIAEDGSTFLYPGAEHWLPAPVIDHIKREQKREIARRIDALRGGRPLPDLARRTVILVDDGIAMGSTMRAAIANCTNAGAAAIVVAAPVSGAQTASDIGRLVDEIVVLEQPPDFHAVAQVYRHWYDVSDREVLEILAEWEEGRRKG